MSLYFGGKYLPFGLICFVNAFSKALFMSLQAAGWSHKQSWNVTRTVLASNLLGTTCFPSKSPAFFFHALKKVTSALMILTSGADSLQLP